MQKLTTISAWTLSALFHPLLIIMYMLFMYLLVNPYLFPYRSGKEFGAILLIVFFTSVAIPMVAILLMYSTGLVKSLEMKERTDRIGPLMCTSIAYLWLFLNIRTHNAMPAVFSAFVLGAIIALFVAFFINNFSKISLHAVALGGFFFAFLHLVYSYGRPYTSLLLSDNMILSVHNLLMLAILTIVIGAVLSSRLYLKAHRPEDVFGGFIVGLISQLAAFMFFLN
ncbi:MAG: phosphatase PAP2 family protein [Saprospiraceae bacterium]|jgi:membrane-associated phospholipid phosphatase|nr:hypothetical protein [Chitinophagia bacterium]